MDAITFNTLLTASLLTLQSLPLLLTPGLTIAVLTKNHEAAGLESHLCRSLGLSLLVLAVLTFTWSGLTLSEVPAISGSSAASASASSSDQPPPYTSGSEDEDGAGSQGQTQSATSETIKKPTAVLALATLYHIASAILSYTTYAQPTYLTGAAESGGGNAWFLLGTACSTIAACVGGWCLIFAGSTNGRSRSSGWLFPSEQSIEKRRAKRDRRLRRKLR